MGKKLAASVILVILLVVVFLLLKNMSDIQNSIMVKNGDIQIIPIEHASLVLKWGGKVIYVDPVKSQEGLNAFISQPDPDLILLTDIHPDHLDIKTLETVSKSKTLLIAPMAVADMIPNIVPGDLLVMKNGQKTNQKTSQKVNLNGFSIEAVPSYNLPEKKDSFHTKGRGNGYILEEGGKRVYISGDTSATPEMENLKNIDIAFICMNLPYTMSVEEAARGVLAFKPKQVFPYHYRQSPTKDFADVNKFKSLVNTGDPSIDVVLLNWYPK